MRERARVRRLVVLEEDNRVGGELAGERDALCGCHIGLLRVVVDLVKGAHLKEGREDTQRAVVDPVGRDGAAVHRRSDGLVVHVRGARHLLVEQVCIWRWYAYAGRAGMHMQVCTIVT